MGIRRSLWKRSTLGSGKREENQAGLDERGTPGLEDSTSGPGSGRSGMTPADPNPSELSKVPQGPVLGPRILPCLLEQETMFGWDSRGSAAP